MTEYTDVEKQAFVDQWNAADAAQPMEEWQQAMRDADGALMPRWAEDIIAKLGTAGMAQETVDAYNAKRAERAKKPA